MPTKIVLRSFAKLNLGLHILGKREDGYHEIRTIFQSIDLHDRLVIQKSGIGGVSLECNLPELQTERNLVMKAIGALRKSCLLSDGLHVRLEKQIPLGAGLGGGSSNAAVTILGLDRLLGLKLSRGMLFELGGMLGADVPYFLVGGTALGLGRGGEVYPLEERVEEHVVLLVPPFPVATSDAYERATLTLTNRCNKSKIPVFCSGYLDSLSSKRLQENEFEKVVFEDHSELQGLKRELIHLGAREVGLTGSGAVLFALFDSRPDLRKIQEGLSVPGVRLIRTQTLSRGQYVEDLVESLQ